MGVDTMTFDSDVFGRPSIEILPFELVEEILEYAQYSPTGIVDRKSLRSCSLVCKSWTWKAQRLLFANVVLFKSYELITFRETLGQSTEKADFLRASVKQLLVKTDQGSPTDLRPITIHMVAETIIFCPNLEVLELEFFSSRFPNPSTLDLLTVAPPFQTLLIYNNSTQGQVLYEVLNCFPHLRFLTIDRHELRDFQIKNRKAPFALYELAWTARGVPPPEFMAWLLGGSQDSLQILSFRETPDVQIFNSIIDNHFHTLRSIRLESSGDIEHARAIRICSRLEEVQIKTYPSPYLVLALLNSPSLEHFSFCGTDQTAKSNLLDSVIELIVSLPKIRVVTWSMCLPEDHEDFQRILEVCRSRRVQFRYFADRLGRFPGEQEPMIEVKKFPRFMRHSNRRPKPRYPWNFNDNS
ncbi:hypothetical protein FRC03_008671 [Tulasnella sp. 419]|nr:hypothetical protein FRC03_008671 [Tulasnella sp. 419]